MRASRLIVKEPGSPENGSLFPAWNDAAIESRSTVHDGDLCWNPGDSTSVLQITPIWSGLNLLATRKAVFAFMDHEKSVRATGCFKDCYSLEMTMGALLNEQ